MENTYQSNTEALATDETNSKTGLVAAGGILGAVAASACCLLPLVLTILGVSGAWMSSLRALEVYQPYFIALSLGALAYGFYQVYWKPKRACAEGSSCAQPVLPNYLVKTGLWLGLFIVVAVLTFPYWFPIIVPYLP
jgi:mercuric ion transport protein